MKKILYVVQCHFITDGCWEICDFTDYTYSHTSFFKAHRQKRAIQEYLQEHGNKKWYKNRFRVVKYIPKKH